MGHDWMIQGRPTDCRTIAHPTTRLYPLPIFATVVAVLKQTHEKAGHQAGLARTSIVETTRPIDKEFVMTKTTLLMRLLMERTQVACMSFRRA